MKALLLKSACQFDLVDMPTPEIGPNEVLIRVAACGICGSDIHGMDGRTGRRIPPIVMGHEAAGVIESVGSAVEGWTVGDRVTFDSTVFCGKCWFCRRGEINLCEDRRVMGVSCAEYRQHGAFAEYVAVPSHILHRLPENLPFVQAAMVEPVSIALHAVNRIPSRYVMTEGGGCAVVVGSGMIGLLVIQALRAAGFETVVAVDLDQRKLDLACTLGATAGMRSDLVDVPQAVRELTDGRGADVAMEVVGIEPTVELSIDVVRKGGAVGLVGNLTPRIGMSLQKVVTREISLFGSCSSQGEYPEALAAIARGSIKVDPLISATVPLSEGAEWFDRLYRTPEGLMKVIVTP